MKKVLTFFFICISLLLLPQCLIAAVTQSVTYTLSATVPAATGVTITSQKLSTSAVGTSSNLLAATTAAETSIALSFDPMTFDSGNGIWLPARYHIIQVAPSGGPGSTDVVVTYTEGANPNAPGKGLGWKATMTFMKATIDGGGNTIETPITSHGPKRMLIELNGEHITSSEITNQGWLKMYVGVVTKDPGATFPDPAASEPFTNADHSGYYDGTILITATVT